MKTKLTNVVMKWGALERTMLITVLLLGIYWPATPVSGQEPAYNTPFLTDEQLEDYGSMTADQIREFLTKHGSYFKQPIQDVDGVTFDPAEVIAQAASLYRINPKVILVTLQKESVGVTRTTRPSDTNLRFLMGCISPNTAREQLTCAAERFRSYHDQLTNTGSSPSGWRVGVPKTTQDGVTVTPATKAVAGQFTYTPYAGVQWGGNIRSVGGVYLFYNWWNQFGFGAPISRKLDLVFVIDTTGSMFDDIDAVKASATDIVNAIASSGVDFRIGLVTYKDHPISPFGGPGDYPSRIELNFSTDGATVVGAINGLTVGGGADAPESVYSGLMTGIGFPWRNDAKKAIILMGDAPPHDPEPVTGFTLTSVVTAANAVDPASIYPIFIGFDSSARAFFQQLADGTGGKTFEAALASDVVNALLEAIQTILQSPIADAGGPYTGEIGETIIFDGSLSFDPDGAIVLYEWDFESDGSFDFSSADPAATHAYPAEFSGTATLRVTDNDGRTGTAVAPVDVRSQVADLALTKLGNPDPVTTGQNLTYTLTVINNGPGIATGVTLTDALPTGVTLVSAIPSQGTCSESSGTVTCNLSDLANGATATATIVVTSTAGGTITNTASVAGNETDPDTTNNSATASTTVVLAVSIDIKPGNRFNRIEIEPDDDDNVQVAILSTTSFDATKQVDKNSLTFGRTGDEDSLHRRGRKNTPNCIVRDVNKDRLRDLVCHFVISKTGFQLGDTQGILKGQTVESVRIEGHDSVVIKVDK